MRRPRCGDCRHFRDAGPDALNGIGRCAHPDRPYPVSICWPARRLAHCRTDDGGCRFEPAVPSTPTPIPAELLWGEDVLIEEYTAR